MKFYVTTAVLILSYTFLSAQEKTPQQQTSLEQAAGTEDRVVKVELVKNTSFEDAEAFGKHEFSLNIFSLISTSTFDISYERILDVGNSFGINMQIVGDSEFSNDYGYSKKFAISPYYRMYFLNRKDFGAKGFFVEVSTTIASLKYSEDDDYNSGYYYDSYTNNTTPDETKGAFGFGAAIGRKWINRKGATLEIVGGMGKYVGEEMGGFGKFGITIGKRF